MSSSGYRSVMSGLDARISNPGPHTLAQPLIEVLTVVLVEFSGI